MKRIIAVIFVILCLCGCDMKRIRTESSIKEYETDFSTVYAETVKFSGMKNSEFEKNINAQIQQSIDSDLVAFDSKAQECSKYFFCFFQFGIAVSIQVIRFY